MRAATQLKAFIMLNDLMTQSTRPGDAGDPIEEGAGGVRLRVAFMTGEYPRATDTFIQREVAALRALGHHVQTFSVRTPPLNENAEAEILAERRSTIYLL